MINPDDLQDLNDRPSEELREVMAHCAGIIADRNGEENAAIVCENIAAACRQLIRRAAA